MHLGHSSDRAEYTMNDNGIEISLEVISEEKDLGVWMDDRVKFSTHIGHAVATGNQVLGLIKRSNCSPGLRNYKATVHGTRSTSFGICQCSLSPPVQKGYRAVRKSSETSY